MATRSKPTSCQRSMACPKKSNHLTRDGLKRPDQPVTIDASSAIGRSVFCFIAPSLPNQPNAKPLARNLTRMFVRLSRRSARRKKKQSAEHKETRTFHHLGQQTDRQTASITSRNSAPDVSQQTGRSGHWLLRLPTCRVSIIAQETFSGDL